MFTTTSMSGPVTSFSTNNNFYDSTNKLVKLPPSDYPNDIKNLISAGVYPEIEGTSHISRRLFKNKETNFLATVYLWYAISRALCKPNDLVKNFKYPDDLLLDGLEPTLIEYANTQEKWYIDWKLITVTGGWCSACWNIDIQANVEFSDEKRPNVNAKLDFRVDPLTEYHFTIVPKQLTGLIRYKILDEKQKSYDQTSGCIMYDFKNPQIVIKIVTKKIDKSFRFHGYKFRAPDIFIKCEYEDLKIQHLWYPFATSVLPDDFNTTGIPNIDGPKIKEIIEDFIREKINDEENRAEIIDRLIRTYLIRWIPHVIKECKTKFDLIISLATVLMNGSENDLYTIPKDLANLLKRILYNVSRRILSDKILPNFIGSISFENLKLPDWISKLMAAV